MGKIKEDNVSPTYFLVVPSGALIAPIVALLKMPKSWNKLILMIQQSDVDSPID